MDYEYDALRRVVKVSAAAGEATYRNEYSYNEKTGQLETVSHNTSGDSTEDVKYTFTYDALGRKVRVQVGETTLSEEEYQNDPAKPNYGTLTKQTYGNGNTVRNQYDDFNRVTGVIYGEETEPRYAYDYNAKGQVAHVRNRLLNRVTESEYDLANRPCRIKTHEEDGTHVYTGEVAYDDAFGTLVEFKEKVGSGRTEYTTTFGYDEENRPTNLSYGGYGQSTLTYDKLGRVRQSSVKAGSGTVMTTTYAFVEGGHGTNSTTGLVKSITQTGGNFTYTYDDNGNIVSVVQDGKKTAYTYDVLGQLTQVDDQQENATWVYTYDQGGNIMSKNKYELGVTTGEPTESKTFTYGNAKWKDQLTAVNGTPITYDAIGNPLSDGTWMYTWQNGRQLARMQKTGVDASFVYNENGLRVQKTVNGVVTDYTLRGRNIVHMKQGSNNLHFFYDASNKPAVVVYNGTAYSYAKNLQGDIVAILNSAGTVVIRYVYDAWGSPISCTGTMAGTLGVLNPFRYRGYVYDEETGIYYLRSRFYSSQHSRFLITDSTVGKIGLLGSHAAYTYCRNAPVCKADHSGQTETDASDNDDLLEQIVRKIINIICGREQVSKNAGVFSVVSVTEGINITDDDADLHNGFVDGVVSAGAYVSGAIIGAAASSVGGPAVSAIKKASESFIGGFVLDSVTSAMQDEFVSWFTVRAGTYNSIRYQYLREYKILWVFPCVMRHTYEFRVYPNYVEVWYDFFYCGLSSKMTIPQKIGGMSTSELQEALLGESP